MEQVADDQQRADVEDGVAGCVPGGVERPDSGEHLLAELEFLQPAFVCRKHFPCKFPAAAGSVPPVCQLRSGNQNRRLRKDRFPGRVDQAAHLFLVQFDRFLEGEGAEWFDQLAGRGDVAEDQFAGDGAAGDFREFPVDFPGVFFQIEFRKLERVSTEGRRIYQIGTGCGVSLLNGGQRFRVLQNPRFGTDAGGHASFDQFGSGCAVQLDQSLFDQGVKAGSGHGVFPLFTVLSFL